MRVAYVCADPGVPAFGTKGASVHLQEVVRALVRQGVTIELFVANQGGSAPSDLRAVGVQVLSVPPTADAADRERAALAANTELAGRLAATGPYDCVYERYSLWSFAGMSFARRAGVPGLLEVNAPLIEEQAVHRSLVDRRAAEWVAAEAFGCASTILAVSAEVARYVEQFAASHGRVAVVPNGVDADRFAPGLTPALPAPEGVFTVGFVGSLKPWHGLPILVEAFARLHRTDMHARLLIVGDGPERRQLEHGLDAHGVRHAAVLSGAVAPADVPGWLASMDVAAAPYPAGDHCYFSPLKVYEYMATGLPVVASRIGQLVEVIRDDINGLLCRPGDATDFAGAFIRLRSDAALRSRLGVAARATVATRHTWAEVARRILDFAGTVPGPRLEVGR